MFIPYGPELSATSNTILRRPVWITSDRVFIPSLFRVTAETQISTKDRRIRTQINSLWSSTHRLIRPIPVIIDYDDDGFVASFAGANIAMPGESAAEALVLLRSHIIALFDLFTKEAANLGPQPKRQLAILEKHIGKRGKKQASTSGS